MERDTKTELQIAAQIEGLLQALGDTPEEVAESLRRESHKGRPGSSYCCPVFHYLMTEGVAVDEVHPLIAYAFRVSRSCWGPIERIPIVVPGPVSAFLTGFDAGRYPDLHRDPVSRTTKAQDIGKRRVRGL